MNILGSFMVPHPPLIIPEVGRGSEEQVRKTIDSYENIADQIAKLNPETIIISSPHTLLFESCFYVSKKDRMKGSFERFNAPQVEFDEEIDLDLVNEIYRLGEKKGFPIYDFEGDDTVELDHGTMVPLYFIKKKLPKTKIVVVGLSRLPLITNYQFGMLIKEAIDNTNKKVVFVASGDLSHKLQEYGPYGFVKEGPVYDERIMNTMSSANFNELLEYDEDFLSEVAECGHRSFTIMAGALDGYDIESQQLSHEDVTGVGYGICTFYPKNENEERCFKEKYFISEDPCVNLAKKSIEYYLSNNSYLDIPTGLHDYMINETAAEFVSIHKYNDLRGCIGTILPTRESLAKEIIYNAVSAAFEDYRFIPITKEELNDLEINVDVLSKPQPVSTIDELDPKKYGIIITEEFKRGVLLPDIEGVDTIEQQIEIAKKKAGIVDDEYNIEKFTVIRHK